MAIKMKLLEPFNCRPAGAVMEMNLVMAGEMEKMGMAVQTDEPASDNPGAVVEVAPVEPGPMVQAAKRGRPRMEGSAADE